MRGRDFPTAAGASHQGSVQPSDKTMWLLDIRSSQAGEYQEDELSISLAEATSGTAHLRRVGG